MPGQSGHPRCRGAPGLADHGEGRAETVVGLADGVQVDSAPDLVLLALQFGIRHRGGRGGVVPAALLPWCRTVRARGGGLYPPSFGLQLACAYLISATRSACASSLMSNVLGRAFFPKNSRVLAAFSALEPSEISHSDSCSRVANASHASFPGSRIDSSVGIFVTVSGSLVAFFGPSQPVNASTAASSAPEMPNLFTVSGLLSSEAVGCGLFPT